MKLKHQDQFLNRNKDKLDIFIDSILLQLLDLRQSLMYSMYQEPGYKNETNDIELESNGYKENNDVKNRKYKKAVKSSITSTSNANSHSNAAVITTQPGINFESEDHRRRGSRVTDSFIVPSKMSRNNLSEGL